MSLILSIESGTNTCSVALSNGEKLIDCIESHDQEYNHAKQLTQFIEAILKNTGTDTGQLEAVAVSKGPGSYTGLRIGVSVAKGMCYALNIPLIAPESLLVMSSGLLQEMNQSKAPLPDLLCPMIDARRMEVYTQVFDIKLNAVTGVEAKILDSSSFMEFLYTRRIMFFGNGSSKAKSVLTHSNALFYDNFKPSARFMIPIAWNYYLNAKFEDVAYFEPLYLKDFIATVPKNKTSGNP
ncbi:MAG TPA: tRNA (adenosine(37)-N6)-threonylcarbamoyltransferase complex dimerization subunit type 1 TsaB [Tenuifilaceae bacterium]|nr:tRNA (adenosine(37)-N6)-threonylcarbamoyltransferase complex dimerization subunit type 1 TsaB [Tenuifilaceae bacterium]